MPVENLIPILIKVQLGNVGFININRNHICLYREFLSPDSIGYNAVILNFSKSIERSQAHTVHCVVIAQLLVFGGTDFIPLVGEFPIISCFGLNFQKRTTKLAILHRLGLGLGLCPDDRETRFSGNVKLVNFTRRVAFTDTIIFTYLDGEIPIISSGEFACIQYQLLLI